MNNAGSCVEGLLFEGKYRRRGSPIFDMESLFGGIGVSFSTGMMFFNQNFFWHPKEDRVVVEIPCRFLPQQRPGQRWADDGVV